MMSSELDAVYPERAAELIALWDDLKWVGKGYIERKLSTGKYEGTLFFKIGGYKLRADMEIPPEWFEADREVSPLPKGDKLRARVTMLTELAKYDVMEWAYELTYKEKFNDILQ